MINQSKIFRGYNRHLEITQKNSKKVELLSFPLKIIKYTNSLETTKTAYFSLLESHLQYGLIVRGNVSATNIQQIMVL